ncbi:MAG: MmcQ/YjbR family DNA-binding protein [Saprospiraceae bacterium]|nr:MmcQ/YjbR family DNA-binding protein [Saprospiraceae bacterium]
MHLDELREYCLAKRGATEGLPFGPDTLVFKVMDKIFAITGLNNPDCRVNLKCDPEYAIELRATHPEDIFPGFHMNKLHWNTVLCEAGLPRTLIIDLIDHSYNLIVDSLPAKRRAQLNDVS